MATADEIEALRRAVGELDDADPYTDAYLAALLDSEGSEGAAALSIWRHKAATYAGMVDTAESGSSRRLSQLQDQALKMVAFYRNAIAEPVLPPDLSGYAYTVAIERP